MKPGGKAVGNGGCVGISEGNGGWTDTAFDPVPAILTVNVFPGAMSTMPFNPFAAYPFFPVTPQMANPPAPGVPPPPGVAPEYMPFMSDYQSTEAYSAVASDSQVPPPPPPLPADQSAGFGVPPPPPAGAPTTEGHVMSEYERFMQEMHGELP